MAMPLSRTLSLARIAIVLLLTVLSQIVIAGWPSRMGKQDRARMQDILHGRQAIPAKMDMFVKYKNQKGKRLAMKLAKRRKIKKHVKRLKVVSIHVTNKIALETLLTSPHIEYVEPQHRLRALPWREHTTKKSFLEHRNLREVMDYGIKMIQADQLWDLPPPKQKTTICIVDSGYALGHPDLPSLEHNVTGTSTKSGNWTDDGYGHGTHCAGVIGAIGNNNIGVAGVIVEPHRFKFHIAKSLNKRGDGGEVEFVDAFEGCMAAGAKVISMSFGTVDYSQTIHDVCKDAYDEGVLLVSAAGNDGNSVYNYPAAFPEVMSAVAVGEDRKVGGFSQHNDQVEIAGPGVDVASTVTKKKGTIFGYTTWTGTSMAVPHIAGVAAAVWSYFPECTNNQIRNVLVRTAKDDEKVGCTEDMGYGIVQAKDAYDRLTEEGCVAGDVSSIPLSNDPVGGCAQDPSYIPPPTASPTAFSCTEKAFALKLKTDKWAEETSWDPTDSNKNVVGSGSGYRSKTLYSEKLCLLDDEYTFTIRDAEADGICCDYGNGWYSISYDNVLIKQGGNFTDSDGSIFGRKAGDAAILKKGTDCVDNPKWIFTTAKRKRKHCGYLAANLSIRCSLIGVDQNDNDSSGYESCPVTCGSCPNAEKSSAQPTLSATRRPSNQPSATPTKLSTTKPTTAQTSRPTKEPTQSPTPMPTTKPTPSNKAPPRKVILLPTTQPTPQPSVTPSKAPHTAPTFMPSSSPTITPSKYPSQSPTLHPTVKPTRAPTTPPTATPTISLTAPPTDQPTRPPTPSPTPKPTTFPTPQPSSNPPANYPTPQPSLKLTSYPTPQPSLKPTNFPTPFPTIRKTPWPSSKPTKAPTTAYDGCSICQGIYCDPNKSTANKLRCDLMCGSLANCEGWNELNP